jgi:hypothetical protein
LFRRNPGSYQRDYHTSANHEDLQGVGDLRGAVGIHATRKRGFRCSKPPLGGPEYMNGSIARNRFGGPGLSSSGNSRASSGSGHYMIIKLWAVEPGM